jgi:hypothetical protein
VIAPGVGHQAMGNECLGGGIDRGMSDSALPGLNQGSKTV